MFDRLQEILKQFGPGLLFAGAAIGVSHLVQSTRAGAMYGMDLIWVIIVIHVVKYPFFHFGPRYVAATGESLLDGYKRLGNWAIALFVVFTLGTIFTVMAAVTVVTAGIMGHLLGIALPAWQLSALILLACGALLFAEKFIWLDRSIKFIILLLTVSTIVAVIAGFSHGYHPPEVVHFNWEPVGIAFLIALMGWMPSPLDLSIWVSLWNQAKNQQLQRRLSLKETFRDFNIGYWGTMCIAIFFLLLGALVMHGRGLDFPDSGAAFAGQLIDLYTLSIGSWIYWVIGIAALTTMISTTLTCFDAIPRVMERTTVILFPKTENWSKKLYRIYMIVLGAGAVLILAVFIKNMKAMVDVATVLSFLPTPVLAYMNYRVITSRHVPKKYQPTPLLHGMSWLGIAFLLFFAGWFVWVQWL